VPGPGGRFDPRRSPALATFRAEVDRLSSAARAALLPGATAPGPDALKLASGGYACGKCHDLAGAGKGEARVAEMTTNPVWFPHSRFSHVAHRGVSCAACHPGTGPAYHGEGWDAEKEPIRIAGVDSCRQCHAPRGAGGGGVRHGCTDCHRYHNGDHPLQGRAAGARDPGEPLRPHEFFRGGR
jgi:hypothetical protein